MIGTYALSAGYYDAYYLKAQKVRTLLRRDFEKAFEEFDVLITPTSPTVAFGIGELADDPLAMKLSGVCTIPVNLAGIPALSIPCGFKNGPMPIGLQIMGRGLLREPPAVGGARPRGGASASRLVAHLLRLERVAHRATSGDGRGRRAPEARP